MLHETHIISQMMHKSNANVCTGEVHSHGCEGTVLKKYADASAKHKNPLASDVHMQISLAHSKNLVLLYTKTPSKSMLVISERGHIIVSQC